jgi:hypothetical protein
MEGSLTPRQRVLMVHWMSCVVSRLSLEHAVYFMAVSLLDQSLCKIVLENDRQRYAIGIACIWIAVKYHCDDYDMNELCSLATKCTVHDIHHAEVLILETLQWNLGFTTLYDYYLELGVQEDAFLHLLQLLLMDVRSTEYSSLVLIETALQLLFDTEETMNENDPEDGSTCMQWMRELIRYVPDKFPKNHSWIPLVNDVLLCDLLQYVYSNTFVSSPQLVAPTPLPSYTCITVE